MNKLFKRENLKLWIIFAITLVIGLVSYRNLPDQIPIHFDSAGNINNYGGRMYIFLEPAIILGMIILAEVSRNVDPKKNSYDKFNKQYYLVFFLVSILMLVIQLYTVATCMNIKVFNINLILPFALGLLFTLIGNSMPKYKQNFYAGIRTSWTLSDEEVWFKTHRLAGKVWFIGGIIIMVSTLMPNVIKMWVFLVTIAVLSIVPIVYSYVIYKKKNN